MPAVREAQELARALDVTLLAQGHTRPRSRSPLSFAKEVALRGEACGPLVERVARRYMAARYGNEPLVPGELATLQGELRAAQARPREAGATTR